MAKRRPRYKEKIVTDAGNEIRVYSKRQVQLRNSKKADRLEALRKQHKRLMRKVNADLSSSDPSVRAKAAAVAIADETGARIGNAQSTKERGHKGITTWRDSDLKGSGTSEVATYTGKSGVKQRHAIKRGKTVKALRAMKQRGAPAVNSDGNRISAAAVNRYLEPFGITAKDLRGLKANEDMKAQLRRRRNQGKKLPHLRKERDPVLKTEFKAALEHVAKELGHEPATLRRQYLVPSLESDFMKDGTVSRSMNPPRQPNPIALTEHKPWGNAIPDVAAVPRWAVPNPPAHNPSPPKSVQSTACKALERRRERAKTTKRPGATAVGVARARDLCAGKSVSDRTIDRMRSFFARHDTPDSRAARERDSYSPAAISWDAWGGDPGRRWAKAVRKARGDK